jgi:capsular exopolysaccharide synthesis family protein
MPFSISSNNLKRFYLYFALFGLITAFISFYFLKDIYRAQALLLLPVEKYSIYNHKQLILSPELYTDQFISNGRIAKPLYARIDENTNVLNLSIIGRKNDELEEILKTLILEYSNYLIKDHEYSLSQNINYISDITEKLENRAINNADKDDLSNLAVLEKKLSLSKNELNKTREALKNIEALLYSSNAPLIVLDYINSPVFKDLKEQETNLLNDLKGAINAQSDTDQIEGELVKLRETIEKELIIFANSLEINLDIEESQIKRLQTELAQAKSKIKNNIEPATQKLLVHSIDTTLSMLSNLDLTVPVVKVIQKPESKSILNTQLAIIILAIGLLSGLIVAFIVSRLKSLTLVKIINSPYDVKNVTGKELRGIIPTASISKDNENVIDWIQANLSGEVAESIRSMITVISVEEPANSSKVLSVTSTYSGEGKSTIASWLSVIAKQKGYNVLLIDADMRAPSIHRIFKTGNARGLGDYLSGRLPLEETIYKNHTTGVHLMTGKTISVHAQTLLNHSRMKELINHVKQDYDLIVMDTPAAYTYSDVLLTAKLSDHVLYYIEKNRVKYDDIQTTIAIFTKELSRKILFYMNKA